MISSISTKRGNFTVEFAIVGVFFSLLFAFSGDVIIKLSYKGKLDRLSFSAASLLKEKTQLYDTRVFDPSMPAPTFSDDAKEVVDIVTSSLERSISAFDKNQFNYTIEALTYSGTDVVESFLTEASGGCSPSQNLELLDNGGNLSVVSSWGRRTPIYRVTLCYDTNNWIGSLLGTDFTRVSSSSVIIGR
ncbi:Flp pilus assembly surface protein TadF ATP/GTP-binding motif [Vibrio astriarenae]|nr:Flp pilus assembly surface protein TadF ATP/GTP-binding motif [Vibrio sp. C7]